MKKINGVTIEDELSYEEWLEMKWLSGYHPKIKWVDEEKKEEKELNRKKYIRYMTQIFNKKYEAIYR